MNCEDITVVTSYRVMMRIEHLKEYLSRRKTDDKLSQLTIIVESHEASRGSKGELKVENILTCQD